MTEAVLLVVGDLGPLARKIASDHIEKSGDGPVMTEIGIETGTAAGTAGGEVRGAIATESQATVKWRSSVVT